VKECLLTNYAYPSYLQAAKATAYGGLPNHGAEALWLRYPPLPTKKAPDFLFSQFGTGWIFAQKLFAQVDYYC